MADSKGKASTSVNDALTDCRRSASTIASGTPKPLPWMSSEVRLSVRSSLSGMPLKTLRVGLASTAAASCCAPSPLMLL